jgi:hypothetical protein
VVISDSIGSPGFACDHLGFRSHSIGSPGIPGDHLGISDFLGSPGYAGDHLGFPLASWLSPGLAVTLGFSRTTRFTLVVLWFSRSTALGFLDLLLSVILSRRRQHSLLISLGFFSQTRWWRLGIIFPFFFFCLRQQYHLLSSYLVIALLLLAILSHIQTVLSALVLDIKLLFGYIFAHHIVPLFSYYG